MTEKVNNISDKMQNTTTHQMFTVSRCHSKVVRFLSYQHMKTNIIIGSGLIILYIAKSQRHRDTEILSIGVIILLYIESDVQKLLTYMKVNQVTNVCEFASQWKYGESISDIVGRILDEVDECRKKSKK